MAAALFSACQGETRAPSQDPRGPSLVLSSSPVASMDVTTRAPRVAVPCHAFQPRRCRDCEPGLPPARRSVSQSLTTPVTPPASQRHCKHPGPTWASPTLPLWHGMRPMQTWFRLLHHRREHRRPCRQRTPRRSVATTALLEVLAGVLRTERGMGCRCWGGWAPLGIGGVRDSRPGIVAVTHTLRSFTMKRAPFSVEICGHSSLLLPPNPPLSLSKNTH